jgi:hypothetical protein
MDTMSKTPLLQFEVGQVVDLKCVDGTNTTAEIRRIGRWNGPWTEVTLKFKDAEYNDYDGFCPWRRYRMLYIAALSKAVLG